MNWQTILLIVHGLFAVALLGAITHQAAAVLVPTGRPAGSFVGRFRAVPGPSYINAVVILYLVTALLGGILYTEYRVSVRTVVEQLGLWPAQGAFELKEHFAALGLGLLPPYRYYWRVPEHRRTRTALTALLAFFVWWNFLVGHILNNIRGFGI
jgi:predicted signal transduction protein with EAL and GGDEF domain